MGSTLARAFRESAPGIEILGIDNFSRSGSWFNREPLLQLGIKLFYGDIRSACDVEALPEADWIIDAAANPSVLAGVDGKTSSRQLVEYNLGGTVNLLEYCKRHHAGFILLSTSRVYSIPPLASLRMETQGSRFSPLSNQNFPIGVSMKGVAENFSVQPPVSLYGSTKVASEHLALEYGATFDFPVWINRCGVMAGAGQFGHPAQGIFAFWVHSFREGAPLKYIGFDGKGRQVRDVLHPRDLLPLLERQFSTPAGKPSTVNISGGAANSMSLNELTAWCANRFPPMTVEETSANRAFDIPWMVLDSSLAETVWDWTPATTSGEILEEIARHAENHPAWLKLCEN